MIALVVGGPSSLDVPFKRHESGWNWPWRSSRNVIGYLHFAIRFSASQTFHRYESVTILQAWSKHGVSCNIVTNIVVKMKSTIESATGIVNGSKYRKYLIGSYWRFRYPSIAIAKNDEIHRWETLFHLGYINSCKVQIYLDTMMSQSNVSVVSIVRRNYIDVWNSINVYNSLR